MSDPHDPIDLNARGAQMKALAEKIVDMLYDGSDADAHVRTPLAMGAIGCVMGAIAKSTGRSQLALQTMISVAADVINADTSDE